MSAAVERLRAAGQRAIWAMHGRCTQHRLTDFASRTRMFCVLAAPILHTGPRSGGPMPFGSRRRVARPRASAAERLPAPPWGPAPQRPGPRPMRRELPAAARPRLGAGRFAAVEPHAHGQARRSARRFSQRHGARAPASGARARLGHRTWSAAWLRALDWLAREGGAPTGFPRGLPVACPGHPSQRHAGGAARQALGL
jgi:hypothetical protein